MSDKTKESIAWALTTAVAITAISCLSFFGIHSCTAERRAKIDKGMVEIRQGVWIYPQQMGEPKP